MEFTDAEKIFIDRMTHHVLSGLSFDDAARAVLADGQRIYKTTFAKNKTGNAIRERMAVRIFADRNYPTQPIAAVAQSVEARA